MQTYFCVSISHVEINCSKLLISVDFSMFAYLVFIIFDSNSVHDKNCKNMFSINT